MKHIYIIVIVLLICLIGGGVWEQIYVKKTFKELTNRLDDILDTPNEEYDFEQVKQTHEWWAEKHKYLELFLPHVQLTEIEITYGELLGAVETQDYDSATALLQRIRATSEAISEMFGCRVGNIA